MESLERDRRKIARSARKAGVLIAKAIVTEFGTPPWGTGAVEELKARIGTMAEAMVASLQDMPGAPLGTLREFVERHALNAAYEWLLVLTDEDNK